MPPEKLYQLTFTDRPEYLYAELKAKTISVKIIEQYVSEIIARSNETGKRRILLYRDIPEILSGGEVYFTINDSLKAFAGKKVALVNPHKNLEPGIDFGMTVGRNRGANYKSFENFADAEKWLLQDS
jgi:hypothetical protein